MSALDSPNLQLACLADDFTGATDLANMLVRGGLRTVQINGVPNDPGLAHWLVQQGAQAVVVAMKTRTAPVHEAIAQTLAAQQWLGQYFRVDRYYFKVCSTFDSTPEGNIGPVMDALAQALHADVVPVCPVFPEAGRTLYQGHLFVGQQLLSESSMAKHPLTPMTDANLVRWLAPQSRQAVGLVPLEKVKQGPEAVRAALADARLAGQRGVIIDAIGAADLDVLGEVCLGLPLAVAGSGLGLSMARLLSGGQAVQPTLPKASQNGVTLLAGSCSVASQEQVARWAASGGHVVRIDPLELAAGRQNIDTLLALAATDQPTLFAATAAPESVAKVQEALGREAAGYLVEDTLAALARRLVHECGVGTVIVAGGESSGAVVSALQVQALAIGPQIATGVPWTAGPSGSGGEVLRLALKSGNFGGPDFFRDALALLENMA